MLASNEGVTPFKRIEVFGILCCPRGVDFNPNIDRDREPTKGMLCREF